ncbi:MAG: hypothetical protein NTX22_18215 [Ignavibacteriales bacterium]|nr:hypothetical protein [Ignavibacteriales bacterium]
MKNLFLLIGFFVISLFKLQAQDVKENVKFSGLMFGDYFYNIDNSDITKKDLSGFQFRRIYITTDYNIAENFETRFRLEADQGAGSLTAGGKIGVMVKDAYLKWKGIFSGSDMIFGISPTPAFDVSEGAFQYRAIEKTIMDLFSIVPSRDFGVDLKGKLTESGSVNYWFKIANNSGNAPETDKYKRFYAQFQLKPVEGFIATFYGDFASKANKLDKFDNQTKSNDQVVGAVFLNYKNKDNFSIGAESFYRSIQNNFSKTSTQALQNQNSFGVSFWAWASLSEKFRVVGRFDNYDPNSDNSNDAVLLLLAGIDFRPVKNVSIIPNFELFKYEGKDPKDLVGRVTFYYQF